MSIILTFKIIRILIIAIFLSIPVSGADTHSYELFGKDSSFQAKKRSRSKKRKRSRKRRRKNSRYSRMKRSKSIKIFGERIHYKRSKWFGYFDVAYSGVASKDLDKRYEFEAGLFSNAMADTSFTTINKAYTATIGGGILVAFDKFSLDSSLEFNNVLTNKATLNMQYIPSVVVPVKEIFTRTSYISAQYYSIREAFRWRNFFLRKLDFFGGFAVGYSPAVTLHNSFVVDPANEAGITVVTENVNFKASAMVTEFFIGAFYEVWKTWFASLQLDYRTLECVPLATGDETSGLFQYVKGEPMKDQEGKKIALNLSGAMIKIGIKKEF